MVDSPLRAVDRVDEAVRVPTKVCHFWNFLI